ncbi:ATP-binding protein [Fusobacterium pseudoperiodonticum]|uniref:ATPase n=1 Tax=Fusobacterium pseudoperiodonticum TaxID=2663009 RepID=A0A2G9EGL3_9FUSO|nr:ATP-binding protein [Fusobacterium pseudoperiodonticum]PIM79434.1 ATPase [Fusobacterium pseudoperiodonticum]
MTKRELYIEKIKPFINKDIIKVLTGIRRSGKSVMLKLIMEELKQNKIDEKQFININFENLINRELTTADKLHEYILKKASEIKKKCYIFLDEIQEVKDWEKCINSLRVNDGYDFDIYITGSNAKLLSGELSTYLAGRYVEFVIYPFSFKEFLETLKSIQQDVSTREAFQKYVKFGGMPFLYNLAFEEEASLQYLKDIYSSIILKDITQRNKIRDTDLLERVISYLIMNVGNNFSATSISKFFKSENRKVSVETILNYIKAAEESFLIYRVSRDDLIGKKVLNVNEKYYIADHGMREAILGSNQRDINQIFENIIYLELLRKGYNVRVGKIDNLEVDFVCTKGNEKIYVQVAYLLASSETIEREFTSLEKIDDNYPKYVISMDEFDMSRNGIIHINIIDFLMN